MELEKMNRPVTRGQLSQVLTKFGRRLERRLDVRFELRFERMTRAILDNGRRLDRVEERLDRLKDVPIRSEFQEMIDQMFARLEVMERSWLTRMGMWKDHERRIAALERSAS